MHVRKLVSALIGVVALSPIFNSCAASVDFWDQRSVNIDIPSGGPYSASGTQTVDLSSDSAIASQLKDIQSVQVAEVWLQVTNVDSTNSASSASGSLAVAAPGANPADANSWTTLGNYSGLSITENATIEVIPSADQQAVINQVQQWAENPPYQFQIQYNGAFQDASGQTLTSGDVNFTVESRIHLIASVGL